MNKQGLLFRAAQVNSSRTARKARGTGFTLIELMIVVAVVAILAAIAYPSYVSYITKTNRKAAEACMSTYANYMERYYTTNLRYDQDSGGNKNTLPNMDCSTTQQTGNNYTYSFNPAPAQTTFTVQAAPIGVQATRDTQCGTLTLNNTGTRTRSGTAATVALCW